MLAKSIATVLNQTWRGSRRLIIMDRAAGNGTADLVRQLQREGSSVDVLPGAAQETRGSLRNRVLRDVESEYLAWIEAGEFWHPKKLELQLDTLTNGHAAASNAICTCTAARFDQGRYLPLDHPRLTLYGESGSDWMHLAASGCGQLVARMQTYRQVGHFDPELDELADLEYCLRLWAQRVPIVAPPFEGPLIIVPPMERSVGADAVQRELARVRERHAEALGDFRLSIPGRSDRPGRPTIAGHRRTSGSTGRALMTTVARRTGWWGARCAMKTLSRHYDRHPSASTRPIRAVLNKPLLHRIAHRLLAISPRRDEPERDRVLLTLVHLAGRIGTLDLAEKVLRDWRTEAGAADPLLDELVAALHVARNDFVGAWDALKQGLERHPSDPRLLLASADILAQSQDWQAAIDRWESLARHHQDRASVWTRIRIARAYRSAGHPERGFALLARVADAEPDNDQLQREAELCRPWAVDWRSSLVPLPRHQSTAAAGEIQTLGFLVDRQSAVCGTLYSMDDSPAAVDLLVNGRTIARTWAASADDVPGAKRFSINCADALQYLGDGDVIELTTGARPIVLRSGTAAMIHNGLPSRFRALEERLQAGDVFGKDGRLTPGHTTESKRRTLELYDEVANLIRAMGVPVFPCYGSLLGAVREADFIPHDVGGFDMVVVCSGASPEAIKQEFRQVCEKLLSSGYFLKLDPWSVLIRRNPADLQFLDLCYGWFNSAEEFQLSFGWRFAPVAGRGGFERVRTCAIAGRSIEVPACSEELLAQLYGPGWRVPDQGFPVRARLIRAPEYLLTRADLGTWPMSPNLELRGTWHS